MPEKSFALVSAHSGHHPPPSSNFMGKQYNKIEKRRRRAAYLERKKAKAKLPVVKTKARRSSKKAEQAAG